MEILFDGQLLRLPWIPEKADGPFLDHRGKQIDSIETLAMAVALTRPGVALGYIETIPEAADLSSLQVLSIHTRPKADLDAVASSAKALLATIPETTAEAIEEIKQSQPAAFLRLRDDWLQIMEAAEVLHAQGQLLLDMAKVNELLDQLETACKSADKHAVIESLSLLAEVAKGT